MYVTDANTCTDSITQQVKVFANPIADFSITDPQCVNTPIMFQDQSIEGDGSIDQWFWNDFGFGAIPQSYNTPPLNPIITVEYTSPGNKVIEYMIQDDYGCRDTITDSININRLPYVDFDWTNVCADQEVIFTNQSDSTDAQISHTNWSFYDHNGNYLDGFYEPYGYPGNITYNFHDNINTIGNTIGLLVDASIIVTDENGCQNEESALNLIEIHPLPNIDFIANDVCEGDPFYFNDAGMSFIDPIFSDNLTSYTLWTYQGNINYTSSLNPWILQTNNFPPGNKFISLEKESSFTSESDNQNCRNTLTKIVEIKVKPKINIIDEIYNPTDQCGQDVSYLFNSEHENVSVFNYILEVNPDITINSEDFNYTFDLPGIYPLHINLFNNNGCGDTITKLINIYPNPIASFIPDTLSGCAELLVNFEDSSYIKHDAIYDGGSSEIIRWEWDFNKNDFIIDETWTNYTAQNTIENYYNNNDPIGNPETHQPTLTVTTDHGCKDEYYGDIIIIYATPTAIIYPDPAEVPGSNGLYELNGSSSFFGDNITCDPNIFNYTWITAGETIPFADSVYQHQYEANSSYTGEKYNVYLIVTGDYGCSDTAFFDSLAIDYWRTLNVPNAMNPDYGTDEGSVFLPKGISVEEGTYKLQIFDRLGQLVFETTSLDNAGRPDEAWDGTVGGNGGKPVPQGTYVWKIEASFKENNIIETWKGVDRENREYREKSKTTGTIHLFR
ncbi:gliding motility-associated C-terminal domain-containing protein [Flavobacteriales bacterium]|nr:gliding motility-associated C-terminal domain-containing protein [Flavobacteriales bacterium]